jgi:hypothetical protein
VERPSLLVGISAKSVRFIYATPAQAVSSG